MRFFYLSENLFTHKPIVRVITHDKRNKELCTCDTVPTVTYALNRLNANGVNNAVSSDTLLHEIEKVVKEGIYNE